MLVLPCHSEAGVVNQEALYKYVYLDDGTTPIDNNHIENQIRPWALGCKNWLFADSLRSGRVRLGSCCRIDGSRLSCARRDARTLTKVLKFVQDDQSRIPFVTDQWRWIKLPVLSIPPSSPQGIAYLLQVAPTQVGRLEDHPLESVHIPNIWSLDRRSNRNLPG